MLQWFFASKEAFPSFKWRQYGETVALHTFTMPAEWIFFHVRRIFSEPKKVFKTIGCLLFEPMLQVAERSMHNARVRFP